MTRRGKSAYLNATPMQREVVRRYLCDVLACLRAQYLSYQTSHWQVVGQSFYGNHLLFARLYESVQAQVDGLAEKLVGYLGREVVGLDHQIKHIAAYTMRWSQIGCHHKRGLQSEADLQAALKRAYDGIKQVNAMTLGLDDWIMATANAHEENEYLLQQALTPVPGKKQASKKASTNTERYFYKATDGKWYVENESYEEDWDTGEQIEGEMTHYGPFPSFDAAEKYMDRNFANSGSYTEDDSGRQRPPRNPVKPGRSRRLWGSGAPSAEGYFFDNPEKREVREFADTGAISNDPSVALDASREEQLDTSPAMAVAEAEAAPPTPQDISEEPGAKAVSTLNRFVVESEDPEAEKAVPMNEPNLESKKLMAAWIREIEHREKRASRHRIEIEVGDPRLGWDSSSQTFDFEASDFRWSPGMSVVITNPRTGGKMEFGGFTPKRDRENDITHWVLLGSGVVELHVWND